MTGHIWVITTRGKVVRRDKAKPGDVVEPEVYGHSNSFPDKESAYSARDAIIDELPIAFLENKIAKDDSSPEETKATNSKTMPKKSIPTQSEFRNLTRKKIQERIDSFWREWEKLKPKEKCDLYIKMLTYAYSAAPAEKPIDDETAKRIAESKEAATANRIRQGISAKDNSFEDEVEE